MSDLSDEVAASFETRDSSIGGEAAMILVKGNPDELLGPGFLAMRNYYMHQLTVQVRRCYRQFAGAKLTEVADDLLEQTGAVMGPVITQMFAQIYTDGVLIGQKSDLAVKMAFHFGHVDTLFERDDFRASSNTMAKGFLADADVYEFVTGYLGTCLDALSHMTGFAHSTGEPGKVWDVWMIVGQAALTSAYTAGCCLGQTWAERDVLDGIAIATEGGHDGAESGLDRDR